MLCICSEIVNRFWYPNIHTIMYIYIYMYVYMYLHICLFRHMKATHFGDVSSRCPFCTNKLTNPFHSNLEGVWDFVLNHAISPTILTGGQLFLAPPVAPHAWVPQGGTQQKRPGSRKFFVGIQWFWVNFGRFESHRYTSVEVCSTSHVAYHFGGFQNHTASGCEEGFSDQILATGRGIRWTLLADVGWSYG